ncbi:Type I restriction enzyme EcoKI specificity protein [Yersinia enterocolitica]|uniref:restriction endonuclease subunit S n=1 Tax=Yersinia mollaretii TaxID=33060 RepID=UPI0005E23990|nr:restriction endonuclease subunit S [Yersinia mollaretii]CNK68392.1 Type I restriction enzyme EcoKI specificity protein [Yersinia enterocolitica]
MAKYKAYPEYKDSGVEWLGGIPSSWNMWKLSHAYDVIGSGTTPISSNETWFQGDIPWVTTGELRETVIYDTFKKITPFALKIFSALKIHPAGSIVIAMYGATIGRLGILGVDATTNQACCVMTKSYVINNQYLYYWLQAFREDIIRLSSGGGQPNINQEKVASLKISSPVWKEQMKITAFLDHETAKIDKLIEKQQELIELLKEKRQVVISHAVTKGLNPDVPMKDSGVEWLGEVPEHWDIKSYRYACLIYRGKFGHRPRNDPSLYDGNYPFIQTGDVARAGKFIETYSQTLNEKGKSVSQLFPSGTLMMAIAANIGDTAILGFEAYAPDSVVGFKPYKDLHLEFLRYSFMAALPALEQTSTQSTQANLNIDRIGTVKAVFPPLKEQLDIIKHIDDMLYKYDSIEDRANLAIKLMQERRTALISAAVTGKIDVRDWLAPETREVEVLQEVTA